jgi:hypothetical protein
MQAAARRLMGQKPGTFFGSSGAFEQEIADLINDVARDIARHQDWQALVRIATVTGDGTTTDFALPDDYDRMLQNTEAQDLQSWFWGYGSFSDINTFLRFQAMGFTPFPGGWIIYGNRLRFSPAPGTGQTATYPYITNQWALAENTNPKSEFTADTDSFVLDEDLLTLGLIWRWRDNKGLPADGDIELYNSALSERGTKDRGSRIIRRNSRRGFPGTRAGWPWELGVGANYWPVA